MGSTLKGKEELLKELSVDFNGLTDAEVTKRREQYGPNQLEQKTGRSFLQKVVAQFSDFLILPFLSPQQSSLGSWARR